MSIESSYWDDLDRGFVVLGSDISYGFRKVCIDLSNGLLGRTVEDTASKTRDLAIRFFLTATTLAGMCFAGTFIALTGALLTCSTVALRAIGFSLQQDNYTKVKGLAPEVSLENGTAKLMTLNARGKENAVEHKLDHWKERLSAIQADIATAKPHILHLQEVYDVQFAESLMPALQEQFSTIIYLAGKNILGDTSGSLLATNLALHQCISRDYGNNDFATNRGALLLELKADPADAQPSLRIVATQLVNEEQMEEALNLLKEQTMSLPTFFMGGMPETVSHSDRLAHCYRGDTQTYSEGQEVNSVSLVKRKDATRQNAFPVVEQGITLLGTELVKGAGTDNHAVLATVTIPKR